MIYETRTRLVDRVSEARLNGKIEEDDCGMWVYASYMTPRGASSPSDSCPELARVLVEDDARLILIMIDLD